MQGATNDIAAASASAAAAVPAAGASQEQAQQHVLKAAEQGAQAAAEKPSVQPQAHAQPAEDDDDDDDELSELSDLEDDEPSQPPARASAPAANTNAMALDVADDDESELSSVSSASASDDERERDQEQQGAGADSDDSSDDLTSLEDEEEEARVLDSSDDEPLTEEEEEEEEEELSEEEEDEDETERSRIGASASRKRPRSGVTYQSGARKARNSASAGAGAGAGASKRKIQAVPSLEEIAREKARARGLKSLTKQERTALRWANKLEKEKSGAAGSKKARTSSASASVSAAPDASSSTAELEHDAGAEDPATLHLRRPTRAGLAAQAHAEASATRQSIAAAKPHHRRRGGGSISTSASYLSSSSSSALSSASPTTSSFPSGSLSAPAAVLTERQRAKLEAQRQAEEEARRRAREAKRAEEEVRKAQRKEQKRAEREAWLAYRRQLREEQEAEMRELQQLELEQEEKEEEQERSASKGKGKAAADSAAAPAKAKARRSMAAASEADRTQTPKKAKLNNGAASTSASASAAVEDDDEEADTSTVAASKRRGRRGKPIIYKKPPVEPIELPAYLALTAEQRARACLQDVRPAYFYPDLPTCSLEEWDESGIPVFAPTLEQFRDFYAYMSAVDAWGMRSGIVKVIPPREWLDALPSIRRADVEGAGFDPRASLESVRIKSAIEQNFTQAGSGTWRQTNVVKPAKVWNLKTWADEAARAERRGPEMKRMQRKCTVDEGVRAEAGALAADLLGSRTRSGRVTDSHAAARSKASAIEIAAKRKRKREGAVASKEAAADSTPAASAEDAPPPLEAVPATVAASTVTGTSDSAHSPHASDLFDQAASPRTSATSAAAHSPGPDEHNEHKEGGEKQVAPVEDQGPVINRSMAATHSAPENKDAEEESSRRKEAASFAKRKRTPSVSGNMQPTLVHLLEESAITTTRARRASMVAEESLMLRAMRDHRLLDAELPKKEGGRRKRPDWHSKKLTAADRTAAKDWESFDFVRCWLREAASFENMQMDIDGEDHAMERDEADAEVREEVPEPKDWTPEICRQIEGEYWRGLNGGAAPMYGADQEGTLFTPRTQSWNVGHLDNILTRLRLNTQLPGVTTPYLYLGMWRATFAWHVEDMDLYSINYIHFGAPKQWYAIRQSDRLRFETVMKSAFPQDSSRCREFMRHKSYLASPTFLKERGIEVLRLVHHAQEFVVTYPFGYHSGFNLGFNCAESVNFALEPWVEIGRKAEACACVDFSVRMNIEALIDESNTLMAEQDASLQAAEEDLKALEGDLTVDADGDEEQAETDPSQAEHQKEVRKERMSWLKEGARLKEERKALKKGPNEGETMHQWGERVLEMRKAQALYDAWHKKHTAEINARRKEAQLARQKREQAERERALKEAAERESEKCPCAFCLSKLAIDLVEVHSTRPDAAKLHVHRSCLSLIPETYLGEVDGREVMFGFDNIPKERWKLVSRLQSRSLVHC